MALKPQRQVGQTVIHYSLDGVAERGHIVISDVNDSTKVELPGASISSTERPIGMLLTDVEDLDFTNQPEKLHRDVVASGGAVGVAMTGEFHTDAIPSGVVPSGGQVAFLAGLGRISNVQEPLGSGIVVGRFLTTADSDGFVRVAIDTVA